jgi:hypothetical protein
VSFQLVQKVRVADAGGVNKFHAGNLPRNAITGNTN